MSVSITVSIPSLAEKIVALQDSAAYPHRVGRISAIETHFAWVFLTDEFAYKLKKPIQRERMDHSSLAARRHSCYAELELNRRLAPHVYLAVVPLLAGASGELSLFGTGEPVEWLVKMRRLPEGKFLDRCIREQCLELHSVHAVGRLLSNFYHCSCKEHMDAASYCDRLRSEVQINRRALLSPELGLPADLINDMAYRQQSYLSGAAKQIGERAEQGRIIEGHGDLRPEHIHLGSPECIIDCLEFDRDLRLHDPLNELSYLFIECEMLDATWVGREIIEIYAIQNETALSESLLNFYCSLRAANRAKTIAWHLHDPQYSDQCDWRALAARYLLLARDHMESLQPYDC